MALTKRSVLETLIAWVEAGNGPSVEGYSCLYRGPGGSKCFVGVFIPDEYFADGNPRWNEGAGPETVVYEEPSLGPILLNPEAGVDFKFWTTLQAVHDQRCELSPEDFKQSALKRLREMLDALEEPNACTS